MSPELFDPERLGLKNSHRTESSDCYPLGMVVYEVLSRRVPFHRYVKFVVPGKVVGGKRPERPVGTEGQWFTDGVEDIGTLLDTPARETPGNRGRTPVSGENFGVSDAAFPPSGVGPTDNISFFSEPF